MPNTKNEAKKSTKSKIKKNDFDPKFSYACCTAPIETEDDPLICCSCKHKFHEECISLRQLGNSSELADWLCPSCLSKKPKEMKNDSTPVRDTQRRNQVLPSAQIQNVNTEPRGKKAGKLTNLSVDANPSEIRIDDIKLCALINAEVTRVLESTLPIIINKSLEAKLQPILQNLNELTDSVKFLDKKYDEILEQVRSREEDIKALKSSNEQLQTTVTDLSSRLSNLEQNLREANIEIHGLPEFKNENLPQTIIRIGEVISHPIKDDDILACFRVAKKDSKSERPRTVVAKFRSARCRDSILAAVLSYNKTNKLDKLNTSAIGIGGEKAAVFISEHLSPDKKALQAAARIKARELLYKFVWSKNGKIYMRKTPDTQAIPIHNMESLNSLQ